MDTSSRLVTPGTESLPHAGYSRTFHAYLPAQARLLVLVLHPVASSGLACLHANHWLRLAGKEGFAVVAPDGLPEDPSRPRCPRTNPRFWTSGEVRAPDSRPVDDVAFLGALIDHVLVRFSPRPRVAVAGHSNGAALALRLPRDLPGKADAIFAYGAPWTGPASLPEEVPPVLYAVGEADPIFPSEGGEIDMPWGRYVSEPPARTVDRWVRAARLSGPVHEEDDALIVQRWSAPGKLFEYVRVRRQGHAWPGGSVEGLPLEVLGPADGAWDATRAALSFFRRVAS